MGSRTISLAATVCQVRHVFRIIQVTVFTWLQLYSNEQTTIISNKLSEDLPQLFYFGIAIFPKISGLLHKSRNFSSFVKLPKFPLLGPSDSMSIGPSHIPSFVQNVVSRHLPASNNSGAYQHPGFGIDWVGPPDPFPVIELIVTTRILHS